MQTRAAEHGFLLSNFRETIRLDGASAATRSDTLIGSSGKHRVFYIPFEHVERRAKLVIVGITPGPTQLKLAYAMAQELCRAGMPEADVLRTVKAHAAFGGPMRAKLIKMLRHFGFASLLGIPDEGDLWGPAAHLLHSTSVVPHAAFEDGKMFNGAFGDVLASSVLRAGFEEGFVAELAMLRPDAVFVALGDTPLAALDHCVARGLIARGRVLGAFAHPSTSGGSQVAIYLGERAPSALAPADPVRRRVPRLLANAERMRAALARLDGRGVPSPGTGVPCSEPAPHATPHARATAAAHGVPPEPAAAAAPVVPGPNGRLHAVVSRGRNSGTILLPHIHPDGCYVVSPTKFEADYLRVPGGQPLEGYLKRGIRLRMSAPGIAQSLIRPESIHGREG